MTARARRIFLPIVMQSLTVALVLQPCFAETVYMKDGRCFKGEITGETEDSITVKERLGEFGFAEASYNKNDIDHIASDKEERSLGVVSAPLSQGNAEGSSSSSVPSPETENSPEGVTSRSSRRLVGEATPQASGTKRVTAYGAGYRDDIDAVARKIDALKSLWGREPAPYEEMKQWYKGFAESVERFKASYPLTDPLPGSRRKIDFAFWQFSRFESMIQGIEKTEKAIREYEKAGRSEPEGVFPRILKNYRMVVSKSITDSTQYCAEAKDFANKEEQGISTSDIAPSDAGPKDSVEDMAQVAAVGSSDAAAVTIEANSGE